MVIGGFLAEEDTILWDDSQEGKTCVDSCWALLLMQAGVALSSADLMCWHSEGGLARLCVILSEMPQIFVNFSTMTF